MHKLFEDKQRNKILFLIFCIGIFYFFTTLKGHGWGDDFALYLLHAKNITEGNPYGETGYIYNPLAESYAPQNYPPGFPALIAPCYAMFGLNLTPYKILIVVFVLWMLWLSYLLLKKYLPFNYLFCLIFFLGMSPFIWEIRDGILGDFPATCFFLLAIWLELKRTEKDTSALAITEGLSIYISYAMRTTGIVLIPALLYRYFFEKKRKDKKMFLVLISFFVPAIIQSLLMPDSKGYMSMAMQKYNGQSFIVILTDIFSQINKYIDDFKFFTLRYGNNQELNKILATICFCFFLTGWYLHAKKYFSFIDITLLCFAGLVFVWPFYQSLRYLIPILPFYAYFIANAIYHIDVLRFRRFTIIFILALTLWIYLGYYIRRGYGEVTYGVQSVNNQQIFDYIKNNTEEDVVIMSTKPRAFTLYTGRKGIVYPDIKYWNEYENCLRENHVQYIVTGQIDYNSYPIEIAKKDTSKFISIYKSETFEMFKINFEK